MNFKDISDRVYEGQVYKLFDEVQSSIVISVYLIRPGEDPKHHVNRLLQDLLEARARGVEVTIYINTKFKNSTPETILKTPWFDKLGKAGIVIRPVSPVRMLHDKLIVIDRRIVVEGNEIFIRLIKTRLHDEDKRLQDFTQAQIKKRFFIAGETYRRTLKSRKPAASPL